MDGLSSFEGFRLDRHGLFRVDEAGAAAPVAIGPRAFDLLSFLVRHNGELVSKDQIMDAVWPGIVVGEGNLRAAPHPRSEPDAGQLHPDDSRARLPLCRAAKAARTRPSLRNSGGARKGGTTAAVDRRIAVHQSQ